MNCMTPRRLGKVRCWGIGGAPGAFHPTILSILFILSVQGRPVLRPVLQPVHHRRGEGGSLGDGGTFSEGGPVRHSFSDGGSFSEGGVQATESHLNIKHFRRRQSHPQATESQATESHLNIEHFRGAGLPVIPVSALTFRHFIVFVSTPEADCGEKSPKAPSPPILARR